MKQPAIIVDLDGTLYNCDERRKRHLTEEKKNFDAFNADAINDPPNSWCVQLVHAMRNAGYQIIFLSGREGSYIDDAHKWLKRNLNLSQDSYLLGMRSTGDYRPDIEIKRDLFYGIKERFEIVFAVDDRKCVVDMWRKIGITCLQCAEGDF